MAKARFIKLGSIAAVILTIPAFGLHVFAAVQSTTVPTYQAAGDLDQWQRIDFRSAPLSVRKAGEIRVAIQTRGPSMLGLIRIPGSTASNFDTGRGHTVVDLINIGDGAKGYVEIVALEVLFTQSAPDQPFEVIALDSSQ